MKSYMIIRIFNNGWAQIENENGIKDVKSFIAGLELRSARGTFGHEYYKHYNNGDVEYFFD